ncbi:Regulator of MON1-CCZ1 complex [Dirofilaria immitis]
MPGTKTYGISSSSFEKFDNKLNNVGSNRSLVAANQQLRIQLAFAKTEINRLQNEIVGLQRRIAGLESTNDEERIEMIVRKRLQQRVQHIKSIANRTVQYMEKTKTDFDRAASNLDHTFNFDRDAISTGGCDQSVLVPSACEIGGENIGCRIQRPFILEALEEDIYGEMDEHEENIISDNDLITSTNDNGFERSTKNRKPGRNNRRQTFFVKKKSHEFENDAETSFVEVPVPKTNHMTSSFSTQNNEDPQAGLTEFITSTTNFVSRTSSIFSKLETSTTCSSPTPIVLETTCAESSPAKSSVKSQIRKSEAIMHIRKKRKISISKTPKRCKRNSDINIKSPTEMNKLMTTASDNVILNVANSSEGIRHKRAAAARISSFKEPNLITKMRNSNTRYSKLLLLMLHIGEPHIIFESGSALSEIFYDDVNKKIVTVRGEDIVQVKAYGLESNDVISFQLKNKNKIRAIKFSPDKRLICVQYDESTVDFINFMALSTDVLSTCFSQSAKNHSAHIIGLEWIMNNQILYITNQGLELYQINPEKKSVKLLKSYNISLYWYLYYPYSQLLIVSSGIAGALLNPFAIQNGSIHRLMKFEVKFGRSNTKPRLLERETFIISIYNALYVAVLRSGTSDSINSDIALYQMNMDGMEAPKLTHILCLDMIGAFALHGFDNLIIVHHQSSRTSLIFDIDLEEVPESGRISHPLFKTSLNCSESLQAKFNHEFKLYSPSWVMFQPNFITDANIGVFTSISLDPVEIEHSAEDKYQYLRFLYNRCIPKSVFLENLKHFMVAHKLKLKQLTHIFNRFAKAIVKRSLPILKHNDSGVKYVLQAELYEEIAIEQGDIVGNLFLLPDDYTLDQKQRFLQYMFRYLTILLENKLEVQSYFLNEILVSTMITIGQLERLHQLLLYRIIPDSKQLAFQLLSHEAKYSPLIQLALDMLSRLGTATEEIVEILMARSLTVEAIRFLENSQLTDKVSGLKLIEIAWKESRIIRYAVFSYFFEHGSKVRNSITSSGQFEEFSKKFEILFDDEEIEDARRNITA